MSVRVRKKNENPQNDQYDILLLDEKIKGLFKDNTKNLKSYKDKLKEIDDKLEDSEDLSYREILKLTEQKKEYENKIESVEDVNIISEYLMFSQKIIEEYVKQIKKPVKMSFVNKKEPIKNDNEEERKKKNELILQFLDIAKKYIPIVIPSFEEKVGDSCNCENNEFEIVNECSKVCKNCGVSTPIISSQTQFKDSERINMNQKYKYGMKVHFKDTLNQFQGKQNKYIDKKVYKYLENTFKIHGLVNEIKKEEEEKIEDPVKLRHLKYSKITKDYLKTFLSETNHNKNYEDINLLHYYYTGIKCHDLSKYEESLFKDFDEIEIAYKKLPPEYCTRLNFLNNQYILLQLLRRYKYRISDAEFSLIKTIDKKIEHDEIYEQICNILEWKFEPVF